MHSCHRLLCIPRSVPTVMYLRGRMGGVGWGGYIGYVIGYVSAKVGIGHKNGLATSREKYAVD